MNFKILLPSLGYTLLGTYCLAAATPNFKHEKTDLYAQIQAMRFHTQLLKEAKAQLRNLRGQFTRKKLETLNSLCQRRISLNCSKLRLAQVHNWLLRREYEILTIIRKELLKNKRKGILAAPKGPANYSTPVTTLNPEDLQRALFEEEKKSLELADEAFHTRCRQLVRMFSKDLEKYAPEPFKSQQSNVDSITSF